MLAPARPRFSYCLVRPLAPSRALACSLRRPLPLRADIIIVAELRQVQNHLLAEFSKGNKHGDLYELVQYAGNIVPRLYLLITVGVVYIKMGIAPTRDILRDLVEMCRGVQHPLRGLFLRHYLLQTCKDVLPDELDKEDGNVRDSAEFILLNFSEMNKLWVRMQHQGHSRERDRREKERQDLRVLVGANLERLSSLDSVDISMYENTVLTGVLEQVVSCKDVLAQEYLLECVIQVFPDHFHLATLEKLLNTCSSVQKGVDVRRIIIALIDRLAMFARRESGAIPADLPLFDIFNRDISSLVEARGVEMALAHVLSMYVSLLNLSLGCYPTRIDYGNSLFERGAIILRSRNVTVIDSEEAVAARELIKLPRLVIDVYKTVPMLLQVTELPNLFKFHSFASQKMLAEHILSNFLDRNEVVRSPDMVRVHVCGRS